MLVDLERNDMGRICQTGSVNVTDLMMLEQYSHVSHIVSNIKGILKNKEGDVIVNSKDNILHLLNYSSSFNGLISLDELSKHIY